MTTFRQDFDKETATLRTYVDHWDDPLLISREMLISAPADPSAPALDVQRGRQSIETVVVLTGTFGSAGYLLTHWVARGFNYGARRLWISGQMDWPAQATFSLDVLTLPANAAYVTIAVENGWARYKITREDVHGFVFEAALLLQGTEGEPPPLPEQVTDAAP